MEVRGVIGWCILYCLSFKGMKVLDVLVELDGKMVVFEVECIVKSCCWYQEVVFGYLFNCKVNGIDEIWYICLDWVMQVRVQWVILLVDEIVNLQIGEVCKMVELDCEWLFVCFKFMIME